MSNISAAETAFSFTGALRRALRILRRNGLLCAAVICVAGIVMLGGALALAGQVASQQQGQQTTFVLGPDTWGVLAAPLLAWCLLLTLAHTLAAQAAARDLENRRIGLADVWSACWRHWMPVTGILTVVFLLAAVGVVLLILPGLVMLLVLALAAPARVIDGVAMGNVLEHGLRWVVAGRWVMVAYLFTATTSVLLMFLGAYWGLNEINYAVMSQRMEAAGQLDLGPEYFALVMLQLALIVLTPFVFGVVSAAAYAELKAGRGEEALSEVFD